MNCSCLLHAPNSGVEQPSPERMAADIITLAKDELKINLSQRREEMINAACRGQLEFTYLGVKSILKTPSGKDYNCCLTILKKKQYFLLPSVSPIKEPA